jgi:predicted SnoaL-like aldol condensation-catalyzing enzyme
LIVEHLVFSAKAAPPNESGHNQTDEPSQAKLSEDKEKNKSIIRDFYDAVIIPGDYGEIPEYLAGGRFVRHDANGGDGVTAFMRPLALADQPEIDLRFDEIKFVFGQGDFVLVAARGSVLGDPCVFCNLYRIEGNKIA